VSGLQSTRSNVEAMVVIEALCSSDYWYKDDGFGVQLMRMKDENFDNGENQIDAERDTP
jgi:hypothetical protein